MNATTQDEIENRCEASFGKRTQTIMKPPRPLGQPMDISPPPICPVCKGTGLKPEAS